jgi:DNA-binding transcriptional ArsR family regulator
MEDPAELFEAISHPERIKILKILKEQPSSFASMKRKLGIESSGNLDYHLKKLRQLVIVREDGLYGLSDAGKEALLSVEAIELWTKTKRRKIRIPRKIPKEVLFLGLLEVCATLVAFLFLAIPPVPSYWGYLPPVVLLLGGLCATFGIFTQQEWSWQAVLVKSALTFSMSLFLLNYLWQPKEIANSDSIAIYYLAFVAVEIVIVILALRHPLQDFLDIAKASRISFPTVLASSLCIFSGIVLIALEMTQTVPNNDNLAREVINFAHSISDVTILAGLTVIIGGVLILLRNYVLGALLSILCGLYPRPPQGSHAFDFFTAQNGFLAGALGPFATWVGVVMGSLPILGGAIAMFIIMRILIMRRIRF